VLDDFERAWAALPHELRSLTWIEGVWQVNAKLLAILQQHGLSALEAAQGKPFNPLEHEAVLHEEGDPSEQSEVAAELQRGYRLHERVLRPTLVKVGRPKDEAPAGEVTGSEGDPGVITT
jgi:molecular chaperone GrpE